MPLYQLSTYMAFFLAKAEMKTEKKSFTKKKKKKAKKQTNKQKKQEARAWCKTCQTNSEFPILIYEGWAGHITRLMVPFCNSVLELHLILTWRLYPATALSFQG